ncbi:MAG TPA: glycosyltransferase [Thermoanaerobaculia bacterium]|nr:glycosyltransferase [Thermoanaerobaculia bacterium]
MPSETVLILTPARNAARDLDTYFRGLESLTYPASLLSLGILESDSTDGTFELLQLRVEAIRPRFRAASLFKRDFGFVIPEGVPRYADHIQVQRRSVLAKSRNQLLFRALDDEQWVLWLDADVIEYPPDVIERLLAAGKEIVTPNCVLRYGGTSFDRNAWRDQGQLHLHDLKAEGPLVPLHSVGGTMLLVRADVHRDGLVFPSFPYGVGNPRIRRNNFWIGEIETEGFGIMAADAGVECWGMPHLEIRHCPR